MADELQLHWCDYRAVTAGNEAVCLAVIHQTVTAIILTRRGDKSSELEYVISRTAKLIFFTGRLATANRSRVSILVTTILARAGGVVDPAKIFVVSLLQFLQFRKAPTVLKSYQKENELTYRARFQFNGHMRSSTFQSSP